MSFPSFPAFFHGVHRFDPYPWQADLAERVATEGSWPSIVAIPTGLGKTATLDIALWDLARQLDEQARTGRPRTAPLRIVHVVDRRSIVDQTGQHLRTLQHQLLSTEAVRDVARVREVLAAQVGPDEDPVSVDVLHGHSPDGDLWLQAHRPSIVTTTPHQFVSRLLFRGFGVPPRMAPIHAALTGVDRLVLMDEPHLSDPSIDTIQAQQAIHEKYHARLGDVPTGQLVLLGASLRPGRLSEAEPSSVHTVSGRDRADARAGAILAAGRGLDLVTSGDADSVVRNALVKVALKTEGRVLVFCNTVRMAQDVQEGIEAKEPGSTLLVTARFRPHDRTRLEASLRRWDDGDVEAPRFVVATQTLEAGVDVSAPTVVTEACPWPALQQRVGRLNRRGTDSSARVHVVTGVRKATAAVYDKSATEQTLQLLETIDNLDLATQSMLQTQDCWGSSLEAPILTERTLSILTARTPWPDVDPVPFIAGRRDDPPVADVRVAWRTVVSDEALQTAPPRAEEVVEVPIGSLRDLFGHVAGSAKPDTDFGDASAVAPDEPRRSWAVGSRSRRPFVQVNGRWEEVRSSNAIAPGSLVVLSADLGGYSTRRGWDIGSKDVVEDLSSLSVREVLLPSENAPRGPRSASFWLTAQTLPSLARLLDDTDDVLLEAFELAEAARANWDMDDDQVDHLADALSVLLHAAGHDGVSVEVSMPDDAWVVTFHRDRATTRRASRPVPVTITQHGRDVAHRARRDGTRVGLRPGLVDAVEHAGLRHDDGKEFPAFQQYLRSCARGGARDITEPLAKSGTDQLPIPQDRLLRLHAGLPTGWRHEALSASRALEDEMSDLVVHLVASHHGHARPLIPPCTPIPASGENAHPYDGSVERFERLQSEYGPWGLAFLESVVRLADHAASANPDLAAPEVVSPAPRRSSESTDHDGQRADLRLTGLPLDSPLAWWAALGALVAASELDPGSTMRWEPDGARHLPVLSTRLTDDELAGQLARFPRVVEEAESILPSLQKKAQKVPLAEVRSALRQADPTIAGHRMVLAVAADHVAKDGMVELRMPLFHGNSNAVKTALNALQPWKGRERDAMLSVLLRELDREQYSNDATIHGLVENQFNRAQLDGLGDNGKTMVRSLPLVLAIYGLQAIANTGRSPLGVSGAEMRLPVVDVPVTHAHLVALLRVDPKRDRAPWPLAGVADVLHYERRVDGKINYYAAVERTSRG